MLGVTGGIAAYKAAELLRLLKTEGADVRVIMTHSATGFVTPLTFQALSGHRVHLELLDALEEADIGHIQLARWADLILIAPASADFMARLRAGRADDLLAAVCLAATVPICLAPAMNQAMWLNVATADNARVLQQRGIRLLGPAEGVQACGETGPGRMLEPSTIIERLQGQHLTRQGSMTSGILAGLRVLISAGPTREAIDPVRYISNRSSGKMGYALAEAARLQGADVILVSGPAALARPQVTEFIAVESAQDMYEAVMARASAADIYIGTAAVADYTPAAAPHKLKKSASELALTLTRTLDILASISALDNGPFTVGFAAETQNLETYARGKLLAKSLDMLAGNLVGEGRGFDVDENALYVCWPDGESYLPQAPKPAIAEQLIRLIADKFHEKHPVQDS